VLDGALEQLTESELLFERGMRPETTYTFKHALIQDAAYDSLLKSRRVQIHEQIAEALEHAFPEVREHQPELLARHFSVAERYEAAQAYWYKAGEIALGRVATPEAIAHLEQGLELLLRIPASADRDAMELDLRAALGAAWMQHSGWAHPKAGENQARAWEIAESLGRDHHTLRILMGLFTYQLCRGEARSSMQASHRLFERAEQSGRDEFALAGHWAGAIASYFCGEFEQAFRHAEAIEAMYDQDRHYYLVHALGHDPRSVARTIAAHALWHLGFPDRGLRMADAALVHARAIGHPHDLTWTTWWHSMLRSLRKELDAFRADLDAVERLATEHMLPFYGRVAVPTYRAIERLLMEDYAGAEPALTVARSTWRGVGMRQGEPWLLGQHALGLAHLGYLDRAERLLEEALTQVQRPGWEEKLSHAELLRFRGTVLDMRGDLAGAELAYREAIEVARAQHARMDELQAATALGTLMVRAGRRQEARSLLGSVLGWFTEGFDTRDLIEAKALLDQVED
jgi:tetratricopeptide (TPR) repeat protein